MILKLFGLFRDRLWSTLERSDLMNSNVTLLIDQWHRLKRHCPPRRSSLSPSTQLSCFSSSSPSRKKCNWQLVANISPVLLFGALNKTRCKILDHDHVNAFRKERQIAKSSLHPLWYPFHRRDNITSLICKTFCCALIADTIYRKL